MLGIFFEKVRGAVTLVAVLSGTQKVASTRYVDKVSVSISSAHGRPRYRNSKLGSDHTRSLVPLVTENLDVCTTDNVFVVPDHMFY